jgi:carbonic anhydrase
MSIPKSFKSVGTSEEFDVSDFSEGHENFLETHYNSNITHYKNLVDFGQKPKALKFSCSDSRVRKNLLTPGCT